ncbi:MAG: hypothetical protein ACTS8S_04335 [Giesbergeria sp.]
MLRNFISFVKIMRCVRFCALSGILFASNSFALQLLNVDNDKIPGATLCTKVVDLPIYGENQHQLYDYLFAEDGEYFISNLSSVAIYNNNEKVLIKGNFSQPSNYVPGRGSYIVAWQNGKTTLNLQKLREGDRDQVVAQVRFFIRKVPLAASGVKPEVDLVSVAFEKDNPLNANVSVNHGKNSKFFDSNKAVQSVDCLNILPRWCGDGVIDKSHGEICDDGVGNGELGRCNATCQK